MNWYYVSQGQQAGPVTQEELLALVREGKISEETLVWREGMPNWTAFHQANIPTTPPVTPPPSFQPPPAPNPNEALCVECGKIVPIDETIQHGNVRVCAACKPVFLQKLAEGAKINVTATAEELHYAGFWIRLGAWLIDAVILTVPFMVIMVIVFGLIGASAPAPGERPSAVQTIAPLLMLFVQFGALALQIGYRTYFVGKYGATPGKMACRLKVVSFDGSRISYGRAVGRAFAEIVSGMVCYIGYLMIPFDNPQKRSLHDHICNTRVVHK
jgi:uncharacterized RDD family membrane protein YckC